MDKARWQRLKDAFGEASALDAVERDDYLGRLASEDVALHDELVSLLGYAVDDPQEAQRLPQLERYELIELVGRDGMGSVYRAKRTDGTFEQEVAVKVLRRGLDTDDVVRRFEAERQILANLNHPNIARVLDGGTTRDSRPYVVLEYVDGERLDVYCAKRSLSLRERLGLFRLICSAVAHAHRNLVVHRDIKPANILVAGDGVPKLLDFGIAKLLDDDAPGGALTRTAQTASMLASVETRLGNFEAAQRLLLRSLETHLEQLPADHFIIGYDYYYLSELYAQLERLGEAEDYASRSLAITLKQIGDEHTDTAYDYANLAAIQHDRGNSAAAQANYEQALRILFKAFGDSNVRTREVLSHLVDICRVLEDSDCETGYGARLVAAKGQ